MWKKFGVIALAICAFGFGLAPATTNAGTDIIRDYGRDQFDTYAPAPPPPPRPIYYAPPPPIGVVVYPRPVFYRPIRFVGVRRPFHRYHH